MSTLRGILKELSPELSETLERNWAIAWDEWLPALGVKQDSFNSYPHLRNVESYLNDILIFPNTKPPKLRVDLSPVEIYLLLASVLFHDIGRTKNEKVKSHATISREYLHDERNSGRFGILSRELARSLGRICEFHDQKDPEYVQNRSKHNLGDLVIDPYGQIREIRIAALLYLADHLDSAFTRVLPTYLTEDTEMEVIGAFRHVIRGVKLDHTSRMVKTVLADLAAQADKPRAALSYMINDDRVPANPSDKHSQEVISDIKHYTSMNVSRVLASARESLTRNEYVCANIDGCNDIRKTLTSLQILDDTIPLPALDVHGPSQFTNG